MLPSRHPSASWKALYNSEAGHPVPLTIYKSLDASLRWDDVSFSHFGKTCGNFPRTALGEGRDDGEVDL